MIEAGRRFRFATEAGQRFAGIGVKTQYPFQRRRCGANVVAVRDKLRPCRRVRFPPESDSSRSANRHHGTSISSSSLVRVLLFFVASETRDNAAADNSDTTPRPRRAMSIHTVSQAVTRPRSRTESKMAFMGGGRVEWLQGLKGLKSETWLGLFLHPSFNSFESFNYRRNTKKSSRSFSAAPCFSFTQPSHVAVEQAMNTPALLLQSNRFRNPPDTIHRRKCSGHR